MVGEVTLAEYFLSILNQAEEYKKWGKLSSSTNGAVSISDGTSSPDIKPKRQYPTDHTQVHYCSD